MNVILCADPKVETAERLEHLVRESLSGLHIERLYAIEALSQKLRRPLNRIAVIVFFASSQHDLDSLVSLRPLFDSTRLVLVLPDRSKQMTNLGLQLSPCFVSFLDSSPDHIVSVLDKIHHYLRWRPEAVREFRRQEIEAITPEHSLEYQ